MCKMSLCRTTRWILVALAVTSLVPRPAWACSSTGCLMSANRTAGEILPAGGWRVGMSYRFSDLSAKLAGSAQVDDVRRPYVSLADGVVYPGFHDDYESKEQLVQLDVAYGIGRNATAYLSSTLVADRFTRGGDAACLNPYGARGIGDLVAGVRYRTGPQSLPVVVGLGLKIPTGSASVHERIGTAFLEPMVQPGSGSWDPIVSLTIAPSRHVSFSLAHQATGANDFQYAFGNETVIAATSTRRLARSVSGTLQLRGVTRGRSELRSAAVASTGGLGVYLTPGVNVTVRGANVYVLPTIPLYRHVNEAQLALRAAVLVGVSRSF